MRGREPGQCTGHQLREPEGAWALKQVHKPQGGGGAVAGAGCQCRGGHGLDVNTSALMHDLPFFKSCPDTERLDSGGGAALALMDSSPSGPDHHTGKVREG